MRMVDAERPDEILERLSRLKMRDVLYSAFICVLICVAARIYFARPVCAAAHRLQALGAPMDGLYFWDVVVPHMRSWRCRVWLDGVTLSRSIGEDARLIPDVVDAQFHNCVITEGGLAAVASIKGLDLRFTHCVFDDGRLLPLRHSQLDRLVLNESNVTDAAGPAIGACRSLRDLSLDETDISDDILLSIRGLTQLESLELRNTDVTDRGIEYLVGSAVEYLDLRGTRVTDGCIPSLVQMSSLDEINLHSTSISAAGIEALCTQSKITYICSPVHLGEAATRRAVERGIKVVEE